MPESINNHKLRCFKPFSTISDEKPTFFGGDNFVPLGDNFVPLGDKIVPLGTKVSPMGTKVSPSKKVVFHMYFTLNMQYPLIFHDFF